MKLKKWIIFLLLIVFGFAVFPFGALAGNQSVVVQNYSMLKEMARDGKVDDEIVIIYQKGGSIKDLMLTKGQIEGGEALTDQVDIIKASDPNQIDALVADLLKNPYVLAAERNSYLELSALPNDPLLEEAWQFERIGADKTWDQVNNDETVVVAVLDTGLNLDHPDIAGRTVDGYDFVDDKTETTDILGHGTSVIGCIAATANNEIGMAGVTGLADIKIAPYRCGGKSEDDLDVNLGYICASLYHAASRPEVRVINMSFGLYRDSSILEMAVDYAAKAGKILVSSSGNEGDGPMAGLTAIPSAYDGVISVGSTDQNNMIADFSQYNDKVDLCAPGVEVLTLSKDNGYIRQSGTSFSGPIVAGAAAVLLAADPSLSPLEVENILKETAIDLSGQGRDDYYGHGLIQVDAALARVVKPDLTYRTHVQNQGWQDDVHNGDLSGTEGEALRLEAIEIKANSIDYDIGLKYKSHVENIGWQDYVPGGVPSGTQGRGLRLEAIQIELTGKDADLFDLYYQVHAQNIGWMDWVKNGEVAGTEGLSYRLEGIKIQILPVNSGAPWQES